MSAESETTIALSTNIPIAIIIAASDIRCSAIPLAYITISVAKIEKTNPLPISTPFLNPIKNNRIATTVSTEITRFKINPSFATADSCPWSYIEVILNPSGILLLNHSTRAWINFAISTTFPVGTVEIAIPTASVPSMRIMLEVGCLYPSLISAISHSLKFSPVLETIIKFWIASKV